MKIILTGEPGIGKTTIIKKLLQRLGDKAIGFWTEEVRDPKTKKRTGFKVISTEGNAQLFASKFFTSKHLVGSYGVNTARFESVVLPILEKAKKSKGPLRSHGRGWKDGAVF
jgi:nucleoside-triphosphatase